jgi:hypothetical protein
MNKPTSIYGSKPIFFLLLPLFFVLHGFTENYDAVPQTNALLLWMIYSAAALIFFFAAWIFYRNWIKAAIVSFCIMAFQFFFGAMHDFLKNNFDNSIVTRYSFVLPFFLMLFVVLIIVVKKMKTNNTRISFYLNTLLLLLIFVDSVWLISKFFSKNRMAASEDSPQIKCDSCTKPDIYFLVFDEYTSSSALKELWNYDNSDLDSFLINKGFRILPASSSNYNFTQFSIASTLNMQYITIPDPNACTVKDYNHCFQLIRNNAVSSMLRSIGYKVVNYSIFDLDKNPSPVTESFLPLKTKLITSQTFLSRVKKDLYYHLLTGKFEISWLSRDLVYSTDHNNQQIIGSTLQTALDNSATPRFVYSHIEMPHPPFYYNGDKKEEDKQILWDQQHRPDVKSYTGYIPRTNLVIKEIVNKIIDNAKKPVAIILIGDHGFRTEQPQPYYFRNLNAVYLSSGNYAEFYDSITNVNEFRSLFNNLFNTNLSLSKDSTIFLIDKK